VVVVFGGLTIADSVRALRVLETSHPPTFYIPPGDLARGCLTATTRTSWCEFKGRATYLTVAAGGRSEAGAAWTYTRPRPGYEAIADHVAFYPARMDACYVDDEPVEAQPGDFYGGWITSNVVGPFKGAPGTQAW
jgi:uncharacterized protein (DUF427 family)